MFCPKKMTRRSFIKTAAMAGAAAGAVGLGGEPKATWAATPKSTVYRINNCPVHDGQNRHQGVDALFSLMADNGLRLYKTDYRVPWGDPAGLFGPDDVIVIKVNYLWRCRGITNTDVVRGVIQRLLDHPEGFRGEIVIVENSQGWGGGFNGYIDDGQLYSDIPELLHTTNVNAEDPGLTTVDYLTETVFAGQPVSSYWLDGIRQNFIEADEHVADGYRKLPDYEISYPCFTTANGRRIELKDGVWTGSGYDGNLKLISIPVLKDHVAGTAESDLPKGQTGVTGAVKNCYGLVSMSDGWIDKRHYDDSGLVPGRFYTRVIAPTLNIVDAIWISYSSCSGYPAATTARTNVLLGGVDPVALDYHGAKHLLLPRGGAYATYHNPDPGGYDGLLNHLGGAMTEINRAGGLHGQTATMGDNNIIFKQKSA